MMNLNDFLNLTFEQECEMLLATYKSMDCSYDRYRALMAVGALAVGALAGEGECCECGR